MPPKFSAPRGTSDILPEEMSRWQTLERETRRILSLYNYKEIRTPLFEETELFARSVGQSSEIVQKQMLNLSAQKQEEVEAGAFSLRPEGTASVVRAYIQNGFDKKEGLSKLFYIGPMFRGERPQKGRLRQFHQIGVEAIGPDSASPYLDAEMIILSVHLLKTFGLKGFRLKINSLGSEKDKENFAAVLRQKIKPELSKLPDVDQQRFERNVLRVLDSKNKNTRAVLEKIGIDNTHLSAESREYFLKVKSLLDEAGIDYEETPYLVRGLDYYTQTVFETCDDGLGSQDALGAGGRYSDLVSQLGGPRVDAVGFALGMERILLAQKEIHGSSKNKLTAYFIGLGEGALDAANKCLNTLRENGASAEMNFRGGSMKSQMRSADKSGAEYVVIIGENELQSGKYTVKRMETGEQESLPPGELLKKFKSMKTE